MGLPTLEDLRQDLRVVTKKCRPEWDITTPETQSGVAGGATDRNYPLEYRNVDGTIVPARRRVHAYEGNYQLVKEPLLVAIDMDEISLA